VALVDGVGGRRVGSGAVGSEWISVPRIVPGSVDVWLEVVCAVAVDAELDVAVAADADWLEVALELDPQPATASAHATAIQTRVE
jgi:hypothetical protein